MNGGKIVNASVIDIGIDPETSKVFISAVDDRGEFYSDVFMGAALGGGLNTWGNFPIEKEHQVLLYCPDMGQPVVLGSQYKPRKAEITAAEQEATDAESDVIEYHTSDFIISNFNTRIMAAKLNGLILETDKDARLQLNGDNSVFRISKGGATVDNPLNGQQFIDTLFAYLDVLEAKVNANSAAIGAQAPIVGGIPEAAAAAAELARDAATSAGDLATAATQEAIRQVEQDKADNITSTAAEAQVSLTTTSAQTKTSAEGNLNLNIKIP